MINQQKKILFVYYKLFKAGGVARVLVSLANELVAKGNEVSIVIMINDTASFFELDKRVKIIVIDTFSHWGFQKINVNLNKYFPKLPYKNNIKNYVYDFGQWEMLHKWMNKNGQNYDVIISSWYKLSAQLALNKKVRNKTIAWEHANFEVGGKLWKDTLRKHYKKLKGVVCINSNSLEHYKSIHKNAHLIPNLIGEPFESFDQNLISQKENTLIYVGRLDADKNVGELIDIVNEIDLKDFKFKIIGDGPTKTQLEDKVKSIEVLKGKVQFLGSQSISEIYQELSKSKIFLFTSKTECLPTVLIEANLTANALISYDCNYGPSDIVNEKNGFLIPMNDKQLFKERLQFLINNPMILNNLRISSYEESKEWGKEKILDKWITILK
ncbi:MULTISPECIES: glycosyltransferase [unclassified Empedobacter]|uniref:glycosyltransferase n=1 Tax=unclassified Empedobacter TaxID=2643773 RepID=UPI002447700F|nr:MULTISPECIES: glycosyltransferase [unclassified Empedobacter]MDH0658593.1 glycosyltransferase [Empedobacter sp. GD03865]MDH0674537.1 glycosyltransferase [Empedobacter sp. GD03861]